MTKDENDWCLLVSSSPAQCFQFLQQCCECGVWRIRGRWRLCKLVLTASCAGVSLSVWEYTWPSNQRQQEQRQPRFTIISCTFFFLSPSSPVLTPSHTCLNSSSHRKLPRCYRGRNGYPVWRLKPLSKVQKVCNDFINWTVQHISVFKSQETFNDVSPLSWWKLRSGKTLWGTFESFRAHKKGLFHTIRGQNAAFLALGARITLFSICIQRCELIDFKAMTWQ